MKLYSIFMLEFGLRFDRKIELDDDMKRIGNHLLFKSKEEAIVWLNDRLSDRDHLVYWIKRGRALIGVHPDFNEGWEVWIEEEEVYED